MDFMISSLYMDLTLELNRFLILLLYLFTYVLLTPMEQVNDFFGLSPVALQL